MALFTGTDILDIFRESLNEHFKQDMPNTNEIKAVVVDAGRLARDRVQSLRTSFNNQQSAAIVKNSSVFRRIFQGIQDKTEDSDETYLSSGNKADNDESSLDIPKSNISPDTASRNKTAYDVAGIQVQAVVAQTQIIVENMSEIKSHVSTIDTNVAKILEAMTSGFTALQKQNEAQAEMVTEQAKATAMFNDKGYIQLSEYLKQIKGEIESAKSTIIPIIERITNPKEMLKFGVEMLFDQPAFKKLFTGVEDTISKGLTNAIGKLGESSFLKANNPISQFFRRLIVPRSGTETSMFELENGIKGSKPVPFDNITHRTINDVIPGLLERILGALDKSQAGTTYDMTTGKFTTRAEMHKSISSTYNSIRATSSVNIVDGDLNFADLNDIIQPMIFYMASNNIPIRNFLSMKSQDALNALLWGLGTRNLTNEQISKFTVFWNYFHPKTSGGMMSQKQREALQQINAMYAQMQRDVNELNDQISKMTSQGVMRSDVTGKFVGWNASDIANGNISDTSKTASRVSGLNNGQLQNSGNASFGEIGAEVIHDLKDNFTTFGSDLKKLLHFAVEEEGSIYTHDTVLIEYVKAIAKHIAPDDLKSAQAAQKKHLQEHRNEHERPDSPKTHKKSNTPQIDTSYAAETTQPGGNPFDVNNLKAGFKSKFINPVQEREKKERSAVGWYEKSMYHSDMKRFESDIETALSLGKISTAQADELRAEMNNASPQDYKQTLLKSILQWSPAVIGGLAFGPFGALAGLGIRKYMKKTTADRVEDRLKKLTKDSDRNRKAISKRDKDRTRLQEDIQAAYDEGRITEDQYTEAMRTISTLDPSEYQTGLTKWVKRLGPAVAASLLGFGPLGILAGLVIGKKATETTASKLRKQLKKTKAVDDITDKDKREKLIADIDKKIQELEDAKNGAEDSQVEEIDEKIAALQKARKEIITAGRWSSDWTSLPGILKMIVTAPGKGIKALGDLVKKGFKLAGRGIKNLAIRGLNKVKVAITKALFFYGDPRIKTDAGRQEIIAELDQKRNDGEMSEKDYQKAIKDFEDSCEKYDARYERSAFFRGLTKAGSVVGAVGGFITGSTQKKMASRGNRAVDEAKRLLADDPSMATQKVAENTQETNQILGDINRQLGGNSVSAFDSGTHELLKQILLAINPKADISHFGNIEREHSKEAPKAVLSSPVSVKSTAKSILEKDNSDDGMAMQLASATAANLDDARDIKLRNEYTGMAVDSVKDPDAKQRVRRLFDKTYRNLREDKPSDEKSIFDALFGDKSGGSGDGGGGFNLPFGESGSGNWLWKAAKWAYNKVGGAGGLFNIWATSKIFKTAATRMSESWTKPFDEHVTTREDVVRHDHNSTAAATSAAGNLIRADSALGTAAREFGHTAVNAIRNTKGGSALVKWFDDLLLKMTKSKIGNMILDYFFKDVDEKTMNNMLNQTLGGKGTRFNKLGKAVAAIGFFFDVWNSCVRQLSNIDPEFNERMARASSTRGFYSMLMAKITVMRDSLYQAEQYSGFDGADILANAALVAGGQLALEKIPVYALIKAVVAIAAIINDMLAESISNHESSLYMMCIIRKNFCDDILDLEANVLEIAAEVVTLPIAAIKDLARFGFEEGKAKIDQLVTSYRELWATTGKNILYLLVDTILLGIFTQGGPIASGLVQVFGFVGVVTGLRNNVAKLVEGEITFGEFWSAITTQDSKPQDSKPVAAIKGGLFGSLPRLLGRGRGRGNRSGRGGYSNDLYQESDMYRNSPYDMYNSGCGPIALTAALRQQGVWTSPNQTAELISGYRDADGGTSPMGILNIGNQMGGSFAEGSTKVDDIYNQASRGKPVVMMGQNGAFGSGMHYMTAVGTEGSSILVRDPLSPDIRSIPKSQLGNSVASAIYGKGRRYPERGGGSPYGRGLFGDAVSSLSGLVSSIDSSVAGLFGGLFGETGISSSSSSSGASSSSSSSSGNSSSYVVDRDPESRYIDANAITPTPGSGSITSLDGSVIYPEEIRRDPVGQFPRTDSSQPYSQFIPLLQDLLIAQYKYTLILPSVIACIIGIETGMLDKNIHHKNLGNIKKGSTNKGTVDDENRIYDKVENSNASYEAYQYYGESIYRIGNFLAHNAYHFYDGAIGNLDTKSSLRIIGKHYATIDKYHYDGYWADKAYSVYSPEVMTMLNHYDEQAIKSVNGMAGNGRGRHGRGIFSDAMSALSGLVGTIGNKVSGLFGGMFGDVYGANVSGSDFDISNMPSSSGGQTTSMPNAGKKGWNDRVKGDNNTQQRVDPNSSLERAWAYLLEGDPSAHISTEYLSRLSPYYDDHPHTGVDIGANEGTPIYSPVSGTILKKAADITRRRGGEDDNRGMGNYVQLQDESGMIHYFEHLMGGSVTSATSKIEEGDYIGKVGETGSAYGAHLHYQVNNPNSYYDTYNPGSYMGHGRGRVSPKHDAVGGGNPDYTKILSDIKTILEAIEANTGSTVTGINNLGSRRSTGNSYRRPTQSTATMAQPLGREYQQLLRGY